MEEVYNRLFVGGDEDYERIQDRNGWSYVRACKYGIGGHQQTLGYHTLGAPKGTNYYSVRKGNKLSLNLIDADDPHLIPDAVINTALKFITERWNEGDKVFVGCNAGHSRGPSIAFMYLRMIGEMPDGYHNGFRLFKGLYHKYDPGMGMEHYVKSHYSGLKQEIT